ncbi:MAG: hypothetical protein GY795_18540 [Desulfobacterales bacterium]|nr:hypothetical protein [Desulfobacterales bacterium]
MYRIFLIMIAGGIGACYLGYNEFVVAKGTTEIPVEVELADMEKGTVPENNHMKIGRHLRLYPASIYKYERPKNSDSEKAEPHYKVTCAYYPIISFSHSYFDRMRSVIEEYGSTDAVPEDKWPNFDDFKVLVKTKTFKTINDIPNDFEEKEALTGLVVNRIDTISQEEKKLILSNFPKVGFSNLIILEENRKPSNPVKSTGMMGGGVMLSLSGGYLLIFKRRREEQTDVST